MVYGFRPLQGDQTERVLQYKKHTVSKNWLQTTAKESSQVKQTNP
jgi:hypothetical protein